MQNNSVNRLKLRFVLFFYMVFVVVHCCHLSMNKTKQYVSQPGGSCVLLTVQNYWHAPFHFTLFQLQLMRFFLLYVGWEWLGGNDSLLCLLYVFLWFGCLLFLNSGGDYITSSWNSILVGFSVSHWFRLLLGGNDCVLLPLINFNLIPSKSDCKGFCSCLSIVSNERIVNFSACLIMIV